MIFKAGVNPVGVQKETWFALGVAEVCYKNQGAQLTVTSLTDGVHPDAKNIHGNGFAADLRTRDLSPTVIKNILLELQYHLGSLGYDIVDETGTGSPHIHVEFDPKPGEKWHTIEV